MSKSIKLYLIGAMLIFAGYTYAYKFAPRYIIDPFSASKTARFFSNCQSKFYLSGQIIESKLKWAMMTQTEKDEILWLAAYPLFPETEEMNILKEKWQPLDLKAHLISRGISFPEGSEVYFSNTTSNLIFINTKANQDKLQELINIAPQSL